VLTPTDERRQCAGEEGTTTIDAKALFKEARRRRRRRWALGGVALVLAGISVAGLFAITTARRPGASHASVPRGNRSPAARSVQQTAHLDVLVGGVQISVRLTSGNHKLSIRPAGAGVRAPVAFPRQGYVLAEGVGGYESVSYDLQSVYFSWDGSQGSNPAPASNPADVWLSDPSNHVSQAQEFDEYGQKVGSPVAIPPGSVVLGQSGTSLVVVVQRPPAGQPLLLWNPVDQRVMAALGQFDQQVSTTKFVAWTAGNELFVDSSGGVRLLRATGPVGDWATALAFDPSETKLAVVWAPRPGSAEATTWAAVDRHSRLGLIAIGSGSSRLIDGSAGVTGPLAWAPDGARLYFGQAGSRGQSVKVTAYDLTANRLTTVVLSKFNLPSDFDASTGALISWAGG
jgi:hypothetical protein